MISPLPVVISLTTAYSTIHDISGAFDLNKQLMALAMLKPRE
jgi:hypothetical protein